MKYTILYKCSAETKIFEAEVVIECQDEPKVSDDCIIEAALRDSLKFHKSGQGSVKIVTVKQKTN